MRWKSLVMTVWNLLGATTSIGGGKKRSSPESNSDTEGVSEVKKPKREHRGFTRVEKEILEDRVNKK
jgi:hypothetical protein